MEQLFCISIPALVWGSIAFTLIVAFGYSATQKLKALNNKHGIVQWSDYEVEVIFEETTEETLEPMEEPQSIGSMSDWEQMNVITFSYYE